MKCHCSSVTEDLSCVPRESATSLAPVAGTIECLIVAVIDLKVASVSRLEKDIFWNVALCSRIYWLCGLQYINTILRRATLLPGDPWADVGLWLKSALKGNDGSHHIVAGVIDEDI